MLQQKPPIIAQGNTGPVSRQILCIGIRPVFPGRGTEHLIDMLPFCDHCLTGDLKRIVNQPEAEHLRMGHRLKNEAVSP